MPRDGHRLDEDLVLDHVQRGARLHLRARRRRGRDDRRRRFLPGADRRHAAADQVVHRRDLGRYDRTGRHHRPQRSLPRRAAHSRAHLLQAGLRRWRADGVCGRDRPHLRDRRLGPRRLRERGHRDLPRRPARAPGQDQAQGRRRRRCVEDPLGQRAHAAAKLRRFPGADQRRRSWRGAHHRGHRQIRQGNVPPHL